MRRPGAGSLQGALQFCFHLSLVGYILIDDADADDREAGQVKEIRDYCELDVPNTYLVYLRYALLSGKTSPHGHDLAITDVKNYLERERGERPHLGEFLDAWNSL